MQEDMFIHMLEYKSLKKANCTNGFVPQQQQKFKKNFAD